MRESIIGKARGWFAKPRRKDRPNREPLSAIKAALMYEPRQYKGDGFDQDRLDAAAMKRARKNVRRRMENHRP